MVRRRGERRVNVTHVLSAVGIGVLAVSVEGIGGFSARESCVTESASSSEIGDASLFNLPMDGLRELGSATAVSGGPREHVPRSLRVRSAANAEELTVQLCVPDHRSRKTNETEPSCDCSLVPFRRYA